MSDQQEINSLRNRVGELQHDLDVARTEAQFQRQLNQLLRDAHLAPILCPHCGTIMHGKRVDL
jgi:Tfp pilus assembly protein FimT